ncbi:Ada metal-binding domain-containing protein [Oerskovia jenensis]|uniref:Ada DNA repair metal-binding domain-containing protein n=1 Tax=Oerskovia jenensis TaxID=162169 RepID=A0ABS2LAD5_9CELL|nr:Ada metal-binding domain-containing protein [Oerskovia jenensis]MBM7477381.1 hypothetical protein [Oerskovia jenensis]
MSTTPRTPTTTGPVEESPPAGPPSRLYRLLGADRVPTLSPVPGTLGGHRRSRIYGRLDCPGAARAIARGGYVTQRVFFADEETAIAAGYRPCAVCLRERYREWKASPVGTDPPG